VNELHRSALLEVPVDLAYEVVRDVQHYPAFLPGCDSTRILSAEEGGLTAEVTVSGLGMTQSFITRNVHRADSIHMSLVEGPLRTLDGRWAFKDLAGIGCRVEVDIRFQLKGAIARVFAPFADRAANLLVDAFTERMEHLANAER